MRNHAATLRLVILSLAALKRNTMPWYSRQNLVALFGGIATLFIGCFVVVRGLSVDDRSRALRVPFLVMVELLIFVGSRYIWLGFRKCLVGVSMPTICTMLTKGIVFVILVLSQLSFVIDFLVHAEEPSLLSFSSFICLGLVVQFIIIYFSLNQLVHLHEWTRKCFGSQSLSRKHVVHQLNMFAALTFAVTLSAYGVYGGLLPPVVKTVEIPIKGLPSSMDKLSIAVISDIHLGPTVGRSKLQQVVNMVNELNADIVAVIGDLTDSTVAKMSGAATPLRDIKSRYGKYFVSGNHEYIAADITNWLKFLSVDLGFTVLRNSHVNITNSHGYFCLAGTDDIHGRMMNDKDHGMDLDKAVSSCHPKHPIILLAHQPRAAKEALDSKYNIQLVLSGHTHGGQMFPMVVLAYLFNPFFAGLYRYGTGYVYVTQGAVYWGIPMRMFSESEISRVFLRSIE